MPYGKSSVRSLAYPEERKWINTGSNGVPSNMVIIQQKVVRRVQLWQIIPFFSPSHFNSQDPGITVIFMSTKLLKALLIVLFAVPLTAKAQSLTLSSSNSTSGNSPSQFTLVGGTVTFEQSGITFSGNRRVSSPAAYGVSPDRSMVSVLNLSGGQAAISLFNASGDTLMFYPVTNINSGDPSLDIYPLNSGRLLVRKNIANFTVYDLFGDVTTGAAAFSGSGGGEVITEVARDDLGKTVLLYTPKVKVGNQLGSQAQILTEENNTSNLFDSSDRQIKVATVSGNGKLVVLVTGKQGGDDRIVVLDRYGNRISSFSSGEDLIGVHLSKDGKILTAYSERRAVIYNTLSGEREGGTSFRNTLVRAAYFPEDATIVALTGSYYASTGLMNDVRFHAINLEQRSVARKNFSGALGFNNKIPVQIKRVGSGRYELTGTSKTVQLRANF